MSLEAEVDGRKTVVELRPGSEIIVGREAQAQIRIDRPSISQKHLRISWVGEEIKIEDLGSKFGTFRLPQEAPFKEASFSPRSGHLSLRLSKSVLNLAWKSADALHEPTEFLATSTEVLAPPADLSLETPHREPAVPVQKEPSVAGRTDKAVAKAEAAKASPVPSTAKAKSPHAEASVVGTWFGVCAWVWAVALGLQQLPLLRSFAHASPAEMREGGARDLAALYLRMWEPDQTWGGDLRNIWLPLFVVVGVLLVLKRTAWRRRLHGVAKLRRLLLGGGVFAAIVVTSWPLLQASRQGVKVAEWGGLRQLAILTQRPITAEIDLPTLQTRVEELKGWVPRAQGSSLLYKALLEHHRARALKECSGVGEASWEDKKICLILLFAISVESREEVHPALLREASALVAFLLSLDGLVRAVAEEGLETPVAPFFLESLDLLGLNSEKESLVKLLEEKKSLGDTGAKEASDELRERRRKVEQELEALQMRRGFPAALRLDIPGPLESGV